MSADDENEIEPSDRARELARVLDQEGQEEMDTHLTAEEVEALRVESVRLTDEAVRIYETKFATLPAVTKLREKWKRHELGDEDPAWILIEALSLSDARSQLQLHQIVRIIKAFDDLSRYSVAQIRDSVETALDLKTSLAEFSAKQKGVNESQGRLERGLGEFNKLVPELLDVVQKAVVLGRTENRRTRWEIAGMCAACVLVGVAIGHLFR
jgi:hypothetical protein